MTNNATSGNPDQTVHNRRIRALSLRNRLLITFILLGSLPVLITGITSSLISSQGLRNAALEKLASIALLKQNEITAWVSSLQTNLELVTQNKSFLDNIEVILQKSADAGPAKTELRNEFNNWNKTAGYFEELFIMDENGAVVLSTNTSQEGKILAAQALYREGLKGPSVTPPIYDVSLASYSIIFSRPIQSASGKIVGVLAGRANLAVLERVMLDRTSLGETGETYLVGSNYAILSKLRFGEGKIGETYVRTTGTTNAIKSQTAGSELYNDYRNIPVLGSYLWIPKLQVAFIAEYDQSEALQSSNQALAITVGLMALAAVIAIIVAFLMTASIVTPISQLAKIAENISSGNLEIDAKVQRADEIGVLASAFNTMTSRLRQLIGTLEQRVAERTKALATSAEVSRRLSTILDQKELVTEVVNQVRNAFGYYHTQIYLFDETNQNLVMAGGTGEAGEKMLAQFHKVTIGRGLVGRAAESNQAMLVSDTAQNPDWVPNPLLDETKSEVAIPISIGDQVLGVLDIQHNITNGLQEEDIVSLQAISNQVAVALQNIRQYEQTQKIATDLGVVANVAIATSTINESGRLLQEVVDLAKKSFNLYHAHIYLLNETGDVLVLAAGAGEVGEKMVSEGRSIPIDREQSLVARAARTQAGVVVNDVTLDPEFLPNPLLPETRSEMAVPMLVAGKVIGVLDVQSEHANRFTETDVSIKTTMASQIAIALQNARSFAQTQQKANREITLNLIGQKIQGATSVEAALQIAARELGHALGKKQTVVALDTSALSVERNSSINKEESQNA